MSATIDFTTVTNSIAALTVSGVTLKDADEITASRLAQAAVLSPRPEDFITDFSVTPDEISKQKFTIRYTLNYVYFHCQIGSQLDFPVYAAMLTKIAAILVAMINNNTISGALDTEAPKISNFGSVVDPAGNAYFGCVISLDIMQFLN